MFNITLCITVKIVKCFKGPKLGPLTLVCTCDRIEYKRQKIVNRGTVYTPAEHGKCASYIVMSKNRLPNGTYLSLGLGVASIGFNHL